MVEKTLKWLGDIPYDWDVTRISSLFTERNEKVNDVDYPPLSVTKKGILSQIENVAKTDNSLNRKLIEVGDFVINSRSDRRGSNGFSTLKGSCSLVNTVLIPKHPAYNGYYKYLFKTESFADEYFVWGHGIVDDLWSTKWSEMKRILVPKPPLSSCADISAFLDRKTKAVDSTLQIHSLVVSKLKEIRQAIMTEAVTRGISHEKIVNVDEEWINKTPQNWSLFRIGRLYYEVSEPGSSNYPFLTVSLNTGITDRELLDEEQDRIFIRTEDATKNKRVQPNDLAYNMMRAWQGAFGAAKVEGMISSAYVVARPKVKISSKFMEWLLRTPNAMEEIRTRSHGIADFRLRLYWDQFKNIKVSIPSYEEQLEIVAATEKKLEKIDDYISKNQKYMELLKDYKKSLIYEIISGKNLSFDHSTNNSGI